MATNLHDRLADLAEAAPSPTAGADLWERGRALGRRRTAVTVGSALACLVLLVSTGFSWASLAPPQWAPATGGELEFPDLFFMPSPWLDGTDDAGPIGPLVAVIPAKRQDWWKTTNGVVGVSATTGEYRFLDLAGARTHPHEPMDVELSPQGGRVAYWITGKTSGQPHARRAPTVVVGYAVYDTVTGEVSNREVFPSEHGLSEGQLGWADEDTLLVDFCRYRAGWEAQDSTGDSCAQWRRDLDEGAARKLRSDLYESNGTGQLLADTGRNRVVLVDVEHPGDRRVVTTSLPMLQGESPDVLVAPGGRNIAAFWAGANPKLGWLLPKPLIVGTVGSSDQVQMHKVPKYTSKDTLLAWRDDTRVVLISYENTEGARLVSVDVRTGATEDMASVDVTSEGHMPELATGLLDSPVVHATAPPTPMDPRLALGLSIAGTLVAIGGLIALIRWRRRAGP